MDLPGRRYLCAGCRGAVLICSHCDRGHRYCTTTCAEAARHHALRAAGSRYQASLRGHVGAVAAWGDCPRVALYDNLKSAVLERSGSVIRFHPTLLALSGHYHYEPRPVAVARGNEKGRVERPLAEYPAHHRQRLRRALAADLAGVKVGAGKTAPVVNPLRKT
ncbi:MAG: hypothetical protein Q8L56_15300 [Rhodocyclaceae bacterium]|nr:hypothetical protein [Rhodocyclaceae bacterium]